MDGWDDSLIYGDAPAKPSAAAAHDPETEKPVESESQFDGPKTSITIGGLAWWVQDKEIEQELARIGDGLYQILEVNCLQEELSGKFRGTVMADVRTEEPDGRLAALLLKELRLEPATPDTKITVKVMTSKIVKPAKGAAQPAKAFKSAPLLYEDPQNPIPKALLAERLTDRPKKSDDAKRSRKDDKRDRDSRHSRDDRDRERERERDRRHRREERDRDRDYYSDYDYDYDYDRRRKDDRDDSKRRRDDDKYRDKRRK